MDDYGKFVYLCLQKSGSTFVSDFIGRHSSLSRVAYTRHKPVSEVRPGTFYFISVRHPFEQYRSLYQFGCDGKGGLYRKLTKRGLAKLYDHGMEGFEPWLDFMLEPENAGLLSPDYARVNTEVVGFQTYRFLRLALWAPSPWWLPPAMERTLPGFVPRSSPDTLMRQVKSGDDVIAIHDAYKLYGAVLRNESLNADLLDLIETHLAEYFPDLDAVRQALAEGAPRINQSTRQALTEQDLAPSVAAKLRAREAFLFQNFYPD
ncbi:hypothetical protein [Tropicimonas marinistellae]|uniref:hypothetical protein n=1 Tax=Tropicimonas marinistellae TaxID=1739787 RepID=UPI000832879F|nr:hypothetical protein [Tropicimonas marinistellae]